MAPQPETSGIRCTTISPTWLCRYRMAGGLHNWPVAVLGQTAEQKESAMPNIEIAGLMASRNLRVGEACRRRGRSGTATDHDPGGHHVDRAPRIDRVLAHERRRGSGERDARASDRDRRRDDRSRRQRGERLRLAGGTFGPRQGTRPHRRALQRDARRWHAVRDADRVDQRVAPGTKKADATKIGIGAGAGAIVGAITGGKKGAAIGSAVGAGGGTGVVLATRGREVALGARRDRHDPPDAAADRSRAGLTPTGRVRAILPPSGGQRFT